MFNLFKRKAGFFTKEEQERIVDAVRQAEQTTSGEVRVYVENRCKYVDALDRATEVFYKLRMQETKQHNAVLVYIALKDHQLAVFGDEGIHQKVGNEYWNQEVGRMIQQFNKEDYAEGIRQCIIDIGEALHTHYPFNRTTDKNELPDEIVFGN